MFPQSLHLERQRILPSLDEAGSPKRRARCAAIARGLFRELEQNKQLPGGFDSKIF